MSSERLGESIVFIVDDDDALRAAVGRLVRSIGLNRLEGYAVFATLVIPLGPAKK